MKAYQNKLDYRQWHIYTKCNCKQYGASPTTTCKEKGHYSTTLIAEDARHAVEMYKTFRFFPQEGSGPTYMQWPNGGSL